jgi:hypothetical protein
MTPHSRSGRLPAKVHWSALAICTQAPRPPSPRPLAPPATSGGAQLGCDIDYQASGSMRAMTMTLQREGMAYVLNVPTFTAQPYSSVEKPSREEVHARASTSDP